MSDITIEARDLRKWYEDDGVRVDAVRGVDVAIKAGELVAIVGPSGSGKSTLLHLLGGLATPSAGQVLIGDHDLATLDDDDLAAVRRDHIGFIFQAFNLIDVLTVEENLQVPATLAGLDQRRAGARIDELLERVGLTALRGKRPNQLSGGERQRVAIARALVLRPSVILADEPTGNLDSATSRQIIDLLHELHRAGETVVLVTHDIKIAAAAERLLVMRDGELSEHQHDAVAEDVVEVIDRLLDTT
ncbi:MAG: ABC transporter ATP-binding protein [Acidimicrobiales bacterium]